MLHYRASSSGEEEHSPVSIHISVSSSDHRNSGRKTDGDALYATHFPHEASLPAPVENACQNLCRFDMKGTVPAQTAKVSRDVRGHLCIVIEPGRFKPLTSNMSWCL